MRIGITMGDPAGVGPEVALKALESLGRVTDLPHRDRDRDREKTLSQNSISIYQSDVVIIGSSSIIDETKKRYNIKWDGEVINCVDITEDVEYGKVSKLAGRAAYESILKGQELVSSGEIDALVTAPVCKASINLIDPEFFGHTELLAKLSHTKRFAMMLAGDKIRVVLVTTHIPINEVATALKEEEIINKIELTHNFLKNQLGVGSPKIGVCALNPHGGEGILGDEETRIISPAIKRAKDRGIHAEGPYPADTLFARDGFDVIIAMYHDQGLIPLKLCEFGGGVNITLGLPFIRTSPDHGTAFDIAGKGIASPGSMIKAIKLAEKLLNTEEPKRLKH
ncbi:4-hydroxythreonine-4-phosphate dehydrogenase PdxA [candidate division WOR-3 bacterium]|nr:4-hydroxythreonine-4-phosphate dehydrogenase PdxA [candidate division WOR-3 bacterium]